MQLPDKFVASAINFRSLEYNGKKSMSRGGRMLVSGTPGHRYAFEIVTPPLNQNDLFDLSAFLDEVGAGNTFTVSLPWYGESRGSWGGTPAMKSTTSAGAAQFVVNGLPINTAGLIKGWDFFKFSNHSKVYAAANVQAADVIDETGYASNGAGEVTLTITKYLLEDVPANITLDNTPLFTVIADADEWQAQIKASNGKFTELTLPVVEYF